MRQMRQASGVLSQYQPVVATSRDESCGICWREMRETYFASQLGVGHKLSMPAQGNLVVDGKWLFEVGGKNKGFKQIKGIEDCYVVSDGIDIGYGNKIPLWLFGLLY